jgi:hypothetical protein
MCVHELQIREQQADTVQYNILLLIQEYDFDLGSGFAWEGTLNICDQLHHVLQLKYNG